MKQALFLPVKLLNRRSAELLEGIDLLHYVVGQAMHCYLENITNLQLVMHKMMSTNFYGAVYCTYYAIPHLKASRGQVPIYSKT